MTFSRFVVIRKGRPQKYSKNRPPPLVRFSPRWAIPPPPPCGRPLWMTPFRRSLITVALSATIIAVRCLVAVKRVSQCGWLWLTMDCPCELTVVDRRPMRTRRMSTRSLTRCTATCSSRWKASVSSSGLSVSQSVSQSPAVYTYWIHRCRCLAYAVVITTIRLRFFGPSSICQKVIKVIATLLHLFRSQCSPHVGSNVGCRTIVARSNCIVFLWLVCPRSFVFPWAVESSPLQFLSLA